MAETVYILCAVASLACAGLLLRAYARNKTKLLLWSCLCFVALALNNIFLVIDLMVIPDINFGLLRTSMTLSGLGLLLYGIIWERA